jgi:CRP/FNR family transcriptional regulator, cyclic AMP receptor protein
MASKSYLTHLANIPLLSACSQRELQRVAKAADEVEIAEGTTIIEQDKLAREAFVIVSGTAEVRRDGAKVAVVGPGECVGEMALLDHQPRTASVVALEPMTLLVISSQAFTALLDDAPTMTRKLLQNLAARLRELDSRLSQ